MPNEKYTICTLRAVANGYIVEANYNYRASEAFVAANTFAFEELDSLTHWLKKHMSPIDKIKD